MKQYFVPVFSRSFQVRTRYFLPLVIIAGILVPSHARRDRMKLYLDYTMQKQWRYVLKYQSVCHVSGSQQNSSARTRIGCTLSGDLTDNRSRLAFTVTRPIVESELHEPAVVKRIRSSLENSVYGLGLINGCPVVDTLGMGDADPMPEWNLYFQFAKLLPDMPQDPVREGYTWERSGIHRIKTAIGHTPCEVYRLYTVDEVSEKKGTVTISWNFRYSAKESAMDNPSILKHMPISGKGNGTAVIDLIDGYIDQARVSFETPMAEYDGTKVTWREDMLLQYKWSAGKE